MLTFFGYRLNFSRLEKFFRKMPLSEEEKWELWSLVDGIVLNRALCLVLESVPDDEHDEFVQRLRDISFDESILDYFGVERDSLELSLESELRSLEDEILEVLNH